MIEAHQLSKVYSRGVYALRDLRSLDKGEFVFLTGPSGAGKSTLLRLLLRQDVPSEGHLIVGGREPRDDAREPGSGLPPVPRLRVPGLQAAPDADRLRERRLRAARARHAASQQQRKTFQVLKWVGPAASDERLIRSSCRAASSSA